MSRRARAKVEVTLFPFLSVLVSMIGVFMLFLIVIVTTRAIGAVAAQPAQPQESKGNSEGVEDGIDGLSYAELEQKILQSRATLAALQAERSQLEETYQSLRDQLELKKIEVAAAARPTVRRRPSVGLAEPIPVQIVEDPDRKSNKRPVYVEITADAFIVHPKGTEYPAKELQEPSSRLVRFLKQLHGEQQRKYLLLLVHPDAIATYHDLLKYFQSHNMADVVPTPVKISARWTRTTYKIDYHIDMTSEPFSSDWILKSQQAEQDKE